MLKVLRPRPVASVMHLFVCSSHIFGEHTLCTVYSGGRGFCEKVGGFGQRSGDSKNERRVAMTSHVRRVYRSGHLEKLNSLLEAT